MSAKTYMMIAATVFIAALIFVKCTHFGDTQHSRSVPNSVAGVYPAHFGMPGLYQCKDGTTWNSEDYDAFAHRREDGQIDDLWLVNKTTHQKMTFADLEKCDPQPANDQPPSGVPSDDVPPSTAPTEPK